MRVVVRLDLSRQMIDHTPARPVLGATTSSKPSTPTHRPSPKPDLWTAPDRFGRTQQGKDRPGSLTRDVHHPEDVPALADLPTGWSVVSTAGPGPFVTYARLRRPDGSEVEWTSRRHRKRLGLRRMRRPIATTPPHGGRRRPGAASLWMGGLFAVGSFCFALGSVPLYFDHVQPAVVASTFFVGSVFFTAASALQFHETRSAPTGLEPGSSGPRGSALAPRPAPRRIDWWAATVQLVGTVFFNITTFAATRTDLTLDQARHLIWAPDLVGSICFLVASWLAYSEVNRAVRPHPDGSTGWWIAAVNMAGSVAFGIAAIAAALSAHDR